MIKVYAGNIPFSAGEEKLTELFEADGRKVASIDIAEDANGKLRGFAYITFENEKDANDAIEKLDGVKFLGRKLKVNISTN
jgi:cold-inducible RNA-binding protein